MLPFLKNKDDGVGVGPVETKTRKPDHEPDDDDGMLEAVASDILMAIESKDTSMLKDALGALVDHIQYLDAAQDKEGT